jgi:ABC-type uncharacterized transport system YnjBCD permease subunit
MSAVLRTQTTGERRGFMKALAGRSDDRILGFTMIGAEAGEVIAVVQTAMLPGLPTRAFATPFLRTPLRIKKVRSLGRPSRYSDILGGMSTNDHRHNSSGAVLRNAETIVIVTLSMIPHIDLLWHMGCSISLCNSRHMNQGVLEVRLVLTRILFVAMKRVLEIFPTIFRVHLGDVSNH